MMINQGTKCRDRAVRFCMVFAWYRSQNQIGSKCESHNQWTLFLLFSLQNKPNAWIINSYYSPSTQPIMLYYITSCHIITHIILQYTLHYIYILYLQYIIYIVLSYNTI